MTDAVSKRHFFRVTGITGASSLANIIAGVVRIKIVAVVLGATGVGVIGLLSSVMTTAGTAAAWGIANTGARSVAGAATDAERAIARRALFWSAAILAVAGGITVYLSRFALARWLFASEGSAPLLGWTAVGVALLVFGFAQNGYLSGLKRVGDLARISVISAVLTTAIAAPLIFLLSYSAVIPYVLLGPVITVLVGTYFVRRIPRPSAAVPVEAVTAQWRGMGSLGAAVMVASLITLGGQLATRVIVQRELGLAQLGLFQASFAISVNYIGLALTAMSVDYFPRLVPNVGNRQVLRRLINDQTLVSLLVAAPFIVVAIGLAPQFIALLYAPSFMPASEVHRWQIMGDVLKLASWPLGFVLLASGRGGAFALLELVSATVWVAVTALLVPEIGLAGAGVGYLAMYLAYLVTVGLLLRRQTGLPWEGQTIRIWFLVASSATVTFAAALFNSALGMIISVSAALLLAWVGWRHFQHDLSSHSAGGE